MLANLRDAEDLSSIQPPVAPPVRPSLPRLNEHQLGRTDEGISEYTPTNIYSSTSRLCLCVYICVRFSWSHDVPPLLWKVVYHGGRWDSGEWTGSWRARRSHGGQWGWESVLWCEFTNLARFYCSTQHRTELKDDRTHIVISVWHHSSPRGVTSLHTHALIFPFPQITNNKDALRKTWNPKFTLRNHFDSIRGLAFHPVEPVLVTASEDHTLKMWNLQKTAPTKKWEHCWIFWCVNAFKRFLMFSCVCVFRCAALDVEPIYTFRAHRFVRILSRIWIWSNPMNQMWFCGSLS